MFIQAPELPCSNELFPIFRGGVVPYEFPVAVEVEAVSYSTLDWGKYTIADGDQDPPPG
jgi:hypothetical protein